MTTHLIRRHHLVAVVAVSLGIAALGLGACGGDTGSETNRSSTTTRRPSTTVTTAPATTIPATTTTTVESTAAAVWPWASSSVRYADPVAAARGFATDLIGFTDPVVGEFRQGDANSGEVDVRAKAVAAPTTVLVRRINGTWWVLGSTTTDIQVTSPVSAATVTSPLALAGTSTAFEATVNVRLVADGASPAAPAAPGTHAEDGPFTPLASGFVMGGSMGDMAPFTGSLTFTAPAAGTSGTLILLTLSAEDGRVLIATTLRLHF